MRRASSASTASPVRIISRALPRPTMRGSRWVPPAQGMTPWPVSGQAKRASSAAETDVAGEGQLQAGAEGVAVDGGDDRLRQAGQAAEGVAQQALAARPVEGRLSLRVQRREVPAATEGLALAREDDGAHGLVVGKLAAGGLDLLRGLAVDQVAAFGSVKAEIGEGAAPLEDERLVGHERNAFRGRRRHTRQGPGGPKARPIVAVAQGVSTNCCEGTGAFGSVDTL